MAVVWKDYNDKDFGQQDFGFGRALTEVKSEVKPVEPPKDSQGNPLTREDINEAIEQLYTSRLNIDRDVQRLDDPEAQADTASDLDKHYNKLETQYKKWLRELDAYEKERLAESGARDYEMDSDEGNRVVTDAVDETIDWFEDELAMLKERLGQRVQERINELRAAGHTINDRTRDKMYESLVEEELIEAWEPLGF